MASLGRSSGRNPLRRGTRKLPALPACALLCLALLVVPAAPSRPAEPPLRVTMDDNYPPFIFKSADGVLQGILVDRWRAFESATGRTVELHAMDWGDALARMKAGEFDVIDTIFRTPEREALFDFSPPYARLEVPIFFRKELSGIVDLASLKGFPVAAKAGDNACDLLKAAGVVDVILHNNYESIVAAAKCGQVNVFVIDAPPAHYFLNKFGLRDEFRRTDPVDSGEFHRAVRKGRAGLLAQVEAGFAAIPPGTLARIDDKWYGHAVDGERINRWTLAVVALLSFLMLLGGVKLRALFLERRRAGEERERMRAQLLQAQKLESIGRLAGGIAHDFNNMLGAIIGNVEIGLMDTPPGDPRRECLDEIMKAARRSAELTRQLLAFARRQAIVPKGIDLNEAVAESLKMIRRLVGEHITVVFAPEGPRLPVRLDPVQVDQLLTNLCVNARDAIGEAGRITISTAAVTLADGNRLGIAGAAPGDYALLTVGDDGCGMEPAALERAFEPFFTTKELGHGTGLGLASVHGIVMQNGGAIDLASERGRGTTVRILLPRHEAPTAPRPAGTASSPVVAGGGETALLVEDEPAILVLCKRLLEGAGFTVIACSTPEEALRFAESRKGDLASAGAGTNFRRTRPAPSAGLRLFLTDIVLPGMNGRELAARVRERHPAVRIVFMSGYSCGEHTPGTPTDFASAATGDSCGGRTPGTPTDPAGADREAVFLQKPFTGTELLAKIREALDGPEPGT